MGYLGGGLQGFATTASKNPKTTSRLRNVGKAIGRKLAGTGPATSPAGQNTIPNLKRGGKIKKTGLVRAHKGERMLNVKQAKRFGKMKRGKTRY